MPARTSAALARSGAAHHAGRALAPVARPLSLPQHVCQVLREDIRSGRLEPGERLTEALVMERTGVSRTPVREGLRLLEAEGLVVSHRGRGAFVTYRLSAEEALLIYDCRLVLEPYLTRLAAERMTPESLATIHDVLERFCAAIEADPREAGELDAQYHLAIYDTSRSELTSVLRGYWARLQLELSERVYTAELPRRFVHEHRGIFEALERGSGDLAEERMRRHIVHGRSALENALRAPRPADSTAGASQREP